MNQVTPIHTWLILMKAHQAMQKHAEISISGNDIGFSDFMILEALLHKGPMPVNSIGGKLFLTSGALTAAVDRLEKKGWVERQAHETDRRARVVHLTPEGRKIIETIFSNHQEYLEELINVLTPDEQTTLISLLKKLGKHAGDRLESNN
jgi:MarR family transcriptional regulator, 2-MHQ and catechol-resistance regulon repressor